MTLPYVHKTRAQLRREEREREERGRQIERERYAAKLAVQRTMPRCETPRCIEHVEKYGEGYLRVHPFTTDGAAFRCDGCGAVRKDEVWTSTCKTCEQPVANGELVGLFVPAQCRTCNDRLRAEQLAANQKCGRCNQAYLDCCC